MNDVKDGGEPLQKHGAPGSESGPESGSVPGAAPGKTLPPAAIRALQEAEARRQADAEKARKGATDPKTGEDGGPAGPEPTRYGDWERKGRAVDFS